MTVAQFPRIMDEKNPSVSQLVAKSQKAQSRPQASQFPAPCLTHCSCSELHILRRTLSNPLPSVNEGHC